MTLRGKLVEKAHSSDTSKLRGSALGIVERESKLRINFKTYKNGEEKLIGKWAYMNVAEDGKSLNATDKDGEILGQVHRANEDDVQGDNYFLETGDMTIMAHKEEKGWTLFDVTNNGLRLAPIDKNSARANNLKTLFHEARLAMKYPGGRKARINTTGITPKTR